MYARSLDAECKSAFAKLFGGGKFGDVESGGSKKTSTTANSHAIN